MKKQAKKAPARKPSKQSAPSSRRRVVEAEEPTFDEWKKQCQEHLEEILGLDDLLDEDDPYDVFEAMDEAFKEGRSPKVFIERVFEEDLTRRGYDEDQAAQALEEEGEEVDSDEEELW